MATFSLNSTIKVNSSIAISGTATYTAPSTGYAIVNLANNGAGTSFTLGGKTVIAPSNTTITIYVGPALTLSIAAVALSATGVEFINSP